MPNSERNYVADVSIEQVARIVGCDVADVERVIAGYEAAGWLVVQRVGDHVISVDFAPAVAEILRQHEAER